MNSHWLSNSLLKKVVGLIFVVAGLLLVGFGVYWLFNGVIEAFFTIIIGLAFVISGVVLTSRGVRRFIETLLDSLGI